MNYSDRVPPELLANPNVENFLKVLDETEKYKEQIVEKSVRFYKAPLLTELALLRSKIKDYGYPAVPEEFPKEILDAILLNMENIMALKGSKVGLQYWLWTLTFGTITVDDTAFYPQGNYIIPSDVDGTGNDVNNTGYGYVSFLEDNHSSDALPPGMTSPEWYTEPYQPLTLFSDVSDFGTQTLIIDIATKYHWLIPLRDFITNNIKKFISFADDNAVITVNFTPGAYVPVNTGILPYTLDPEINQYFVIP